MDISNITNPEAKNFLEAFLLHREINREFFMRVDEKDFDFRMVDTAERKSDSPRDSIAHLVNVEKTYLQAIQTGELKFGSYYYQDLENKSKEYLMKRLIETDQELIKILSFDENVNKKVQVKWSKEPIRAIDMLWSLRNHEILHTGWNIAIMDHLNMERFDALKRVWG